MHCNQCGTIVPSDRTECPICGQRISAPGSDFSQTFGKAGSGPDRQVRLVEPPPKRPSSILAGLVIAIIGAALLIIGVVLAISIPYVVSDGGGAELEEWAEPSQREVGQTITLYLTISHKSVDKGEYTYEFEDAGNRNVTAYSDIGDTGSSVIVKLRWSETGGAEVTTSVSHWYYRAPGIIISILAITVIIVGIVIFVTSRNKYNKQLDDYRKSFSVGAIAGPAPSAPFQAPPAQYPPQPAAQQPNAGAQAPTAASSPAPPPGQGALAPQQGRSAAPPPMQQTAPQSAGAPPMQQQ